MFSWKLRGAKITDLGFIFRVYKITMKPYIEQLWEWDDTAQRQHYEEVFKVSDYQIIQLEDKPIGVLSMTSMESYDFLARLEILPEYQNKGVGTAVLKSLTQKAKIKTTPIMLRVFKINRAQNLYKRLGFQVIRQDDIHLDMLYATVDE